MAQYQITAPDSASQNDVLAYAQQQHLSASQPSALNRTTNNYALPKTASWQDAPPVQSWKNAPAFDPSTARPVSSFDPLSARPAQQPGDESFFQSMGDVLSGMRQGIYDIPQSVVELGARGTDALGLTDGAYPQIHDLLAQYNAIGTPGLKTNNPYTKIGRVEGQVAAAAPLAELAPLTGGGALPAITNSALQGASAAALTSNSSEAPLYQQVGIGAGGGGLFGGSVNLGGRALARIVGGAPTDVSKAMEYVQNLMQSSKTAPDTAALRTAQAATNGKPITAAETIGKPGEVAIGALARRPGATADALSGEMAIRTTGAPTRILSDYSQAAGIDPNAAQGNIDALIASGRATAKPLYDAALATPGPIWSSDLARLSQRPVIKQALSQASEDLLNADQKPGTLGLPSGPDDGQLMPTAAAWDLVKKNLGSMVERDPFGKIVPDSSSRGNYNVNTANRDLTNALRQAISGYGDALDASGDYLNSQAQFNNGQSFILNNKVTAQDLADHVASLTPPEAAAFKGGIANKLFNEAQNGRLAPRLFSAPSVQQKLSAALGPQNAATFLNGMQQETGMANFARLRVPGAGSPTAEYNAEIANQDGAGDFGAQFAKFGQNAVQHGPVAAAVNAGLGKAQEVIAAYTTRGMSVPVRDHAGRLLMMSPGDLADTIDKSGVGLFGGGQQGQRALLARHILNASDLLSRSAAPLAIPALALPGGNNQ